MHGGERADARALDHLEAVVREMGEELATWRARALRAEADLRGGAGGGGRAPRSAVEGRPGSLELEVENRALRQRVEAAKSRVATLVARLSFLEEQARVGSGGNGGAR